MDDYDGPVTRSRGRQRRLRARSPSPARPVRSGPPEQVESPLWPVRDPSSSTLTSPANADFPGMDEHSHPGSPGDDIEMDPPQRQDRLEPRVEPGRTHRTANSAVEPAHPPGHATGVVQSPQPRRLSTLLAELRRRSSSCLSSESPSSQYEWDFEYHDLAHQRKRYRELSEDRDQIPPICACDVNHEAKITRLQKAAEDTNWSIKSDMVFICGHVSSLSWKFRGPVSLKEAKSAEYQSFDIVTPDYVSYLTHPRLWQPLFEAAIWHYLISEVFDTETTIWAGQAGGYYEKICNQVKKNMLEFEEYPKMVEFHDARGRMGHFIGRYAEAYNSNLFQHPEEKEEFADRFLKNFKLFLKEDIGAIPVMKSIRGLVSHAADMKSTFQRERATFKLVMTNAAGNEQHHFDYDTTCMSRHETDIDVEAEYLPDGKRPKVAFAVRPRVIKYGFPFRRDEALEVAEKPVVVSPSAVLLEGWDERAEWKRLVEQELREQEAMEAKETWVLA